MPDAPGLELIAQGVEEGRQGTVIETAFEHGRATLIVHPEGVLHALRWLRDTPEQGYTFLSSLHAADYLPATPRFAVHYELLCRDRVERINVKALLQDPAAGDDSNGASPEEKLPERGADTLVRPTVTPDLALTAEPPPVPRDMPLTASTRDGTEMVRAAGGWGVVDSTEPV